MAMGWDDAIMLLMAGMQTYSAMNPPENNFQTPAGGAGQMPQGMGAQPFAPPQGQSNAAAPGVQPIQTDPLEGIAAALASTGPPPSQPVSQPTTSGRKETIGPPAPSEDPLVQNQKNKAATDSIWAALPQAIAMAAPLLMGGNDKRQVAAPVAGSGGGNQTVFQSPTRRPSIGELLNSLPRLQ